MSGRHRFAARTVILTVIVVIALSLSLRLAANALVDEGDISRNPLRTAAELFDVGLEANVATWLSSGLLLAVFAVFAARSLLGSPRRGWATIAAIALALSIDESSEIHERVAGVAAERIHLPGGGLTFAWVVPGAVVALGLISIAYVATRPIPPPLRRRLAFAAFVFFVGALGIEAIGGEIFARHGSRSVAYVLTYHLEESAEFAGIVMALFAGLDSLRFEQSDQQVLVTAR